MKARGVLTWEDFLERHLRCGGHEGHFGGSSRDMVQCDCGGYWLSVGRGTDDGHEFTRDGQQKGPIGGADG